MATEEKKKKSFFDKAIDALTTRDEKAAALEAKKKAEEAEKRAEAAEEKIKELKRQRKHEEVTKQRIAAQNARRAMWAARKAAAEAAKTKYIAEHTLTSEETLSHISLKYYGSATRPYWMVIYEANKDVVGDNPAHVRRGMVLKIPVLPEELQKD